MNRSTMELQNIETTEIKSFAESIAKRVYPLTDKEKNCIEHYGKMIINRGHLSKQIIHLAQEKINERKATETILVEGTTEAI